MITPTSRWDFEHLGPPDLDTIRALHLPAEHFRISRHRYPSGTTFSGSSRAGRRYVLTGTCAFEIAESTWRLASGDIADLPAGVYIFRVLGPDSVELVSVWELPHEFREEAGT